MPQSRTINGLRPSAAVEFLSILLRLWWFNRHVHIFSSTRSTRQVLTRQVNGIPRLWRMRDGLRGVRIGAPSGETASEVWMAPSDELIWISHQSTQHWAHSSSMANMSLRKRWNCSFAACLQCLLVGMQLSRGADLCKTHGQVLGCAE